MSDMTKVHIRVIGWVALAVGAYLLVSLTIDALFGIRIPPQIILIAVSGPMVIDICMRIKYLCNHCRKGDQETTAAQRHLILMAIPAEAIFVLLCILSLFEE